MNKLIKIVLGIVVFLTTTVSAISIDTDEVKNGFCPGDLITEINNISKSFNEITIGSMQADWDVDRMYFTVKNDGFIKIKLYAPKNLTFKAGIYCNSETYFRSENKTSHFEEFSVSSGDVINISIFDWESGSGYEYNLGIEYITDSLPTTDNLQPIESLPNTYTTVDIIDTEDIIQNEIIEQNLNDFDYVESKDSSNGECPAEIIPALNGVNNYRNVNIQGIMNGTWDVDRYSFTPTVSGDVYIKFSTPEAMTIKAGNSCNSQNYFRSPADTYEYEQTIHIESNSLMSLSMFDWETNNSEYDLNIKFTPDNITAAIDTTSPIITLNGENPTYLLLGDTYTEVEAIAIDDFDGDISSFIDISSNINTQLAGNYLVKYTVSDSMGNSSAKIRSIIVTDKNRDINIAKDNYIRVSDGRKILSQRGSPFKDFSTPKSYKVTVPSQEVLQDTINLASSDGGGIVLAYDGTVKTTDSILMKNGVKLIGRKNSKIEYVGNGSDGVVRFRNVNNATIEKMEIDGGGISANTAGIAVIYGGNRNIKISDNNVHNTGRNGISLYGDAPEDIKNVEISRNKISYCGVGYYKSTAQFNSFISEGKSAFHGIETRFTTDVLIASNDISYTDMGSEMTTQTIRGEYIGNKVYHTGWGMKLVAIEDAIVKYNDFSSIIGTDDAVFYSDVYNNQPYSRTATAWIENNVFLGAKNGHKSVRLSDLGTVYFKFNDTPDGVNINVVELIE